MNEILALTDVSRIFRNGRGLKKTSLTVREGEIVGLLGANGSGKSTLMKIASGLTRPDTGEVFVMGENMKNAPEKALGFIGALIEAPALFPYMTARENLRTALDYMGVKDKKAADEMLKGVGLDGYKRDKVKHFSLGMKQRLGLAMAFIGEKKLVLLDEPTNGLDIESASEIKDMIRKSASESGAAIVSSHLASEIERLATRVVILREGAVLKDVSMAEATKDGRTLEEYYLAAGMGERV